MEVEKELIREKLLDPNFRKLIEKTDGLRRCKNAEMSTKIRQSGNLLYMQKEHNNQIHESNLNLFSMSIAYAPAASEELALGYASRSTLLLHLKKYEFSMEDIRRALRITRSKSLKVKLLCSKVECLTALGLPESSTVFESAIGYFNKINERDIENKRYLHSVIGKTKTILDLKKLMLECDNDSVLSKIEVKEVGDFSSIDMRNSTKYGKHLIASQHIKPGEIVYIEKPYVVCPNGEKPYVNCTHCLAVAWNGVPCNHCNWSIFCSIKCRTEAWIKYHDIECYVITHMKALDRKFSQNFQMSLRAVITGIRESGGFHKLKSELELMDACEDCNGQNLLCNKKCESRQFCSIFNLSSAIKDKHFEINIFNVAIAVSYAAKYTNLFGENILESVICNNFHENETILLTGSVLLKFVQVCNNYAYSFSNSIKMCEHANETVRCLKKYCKDKLTYLAPISGLINNSCIPNVKRYFTKDQKIIVCALESISKNSQILESYICSFYETPKSVDRKAIMHNNFKFTCDCSACVQNWPSLSTVLGTEEVTPSSPTVNLRAHFLEAQLTDEYRDVVKKASDKDFVCDEKIILELRKGIERASALLDQPSKIRCTLVFAMRRVFDKIYGYDSKIFSC